MSSIPNTRVLEEELYDVFKVYGEIEDVSVKESECGPRNSGYGFVHYPENVPGRASALSAHGMRGWNGGSNDALSCAAHGQADTR